MASHHWCTLENIWSKTKSWHDDSKASNIVTEKHRHTVTWNRYSAIVIEAYRNTVTCNKYPAIAIEAYMRPILKLLKGITII